MRSPAQQLWDQKAKRSPCSFQPQLRSGHGGKKRLAFGRRDLPPRFLKRTPKNGRLSFGFPFYQSKGVLYLGKPARREIVAALAVGGSIALGAQLNHASRHHRVAVAVHLAPRQASLLDCQETRRFLSPYHFRFLFSAPGPPTTCILWQPQPNGLAAHARKSLDCRRSEARPSDLGYFAKPAQGVTSMSSITQSLIITPTVEHSLRSSCRVQMLLLV